MMNIIKINSQIKNVFIEIIFAKKDISFASQRILCKVTFFYYVK